MGLWGWVTTATTDGTEESARSSGPGFFYESGLDTRVTEVVALPQQGFPSVEREGVCEAVAEVQPGHVASFAEICVGLPRQAGLVFRHRLNHETCLLDECVESSADDRISLEIENDPAFEIACRREPSGVSVRDDLSEDPGVVFLAKDRDDR